MKIEQIFAKPIDRNIQGVIKVGQSLDENIRQELEEYVVTNELQGHFQTLFDAYLRSVNGSTDKMGVWIQGFFGSGKSHFLKIISYLLDNKEIANKRAIDYFKEDHKILNPMTIAAMDKVTDITTDVILFNIDSKSDAGGKKDKNGIVNVFLKVFNEKMGFSTIPHLANLERQLVKQNQYELFKKTFYDKTSDEWVQVRHEFDWIQDDVKEALVAINFMSETAIDNFFEKASSNYSISIEDFAKLVKAHIDEQGNNHHVAFLVDEVGQYIGGNRDLTLNLQTVVEDLGRICLGKAWVIVTSQEAIDDVTSFEANSDMDFSKIKDRFATTLSLSSANADEVIKKRILKKTATADEVLQAEFVNKETELKNKLLFTDSPELKLFRDGEDFAEVYPFIPYQFNLLGQILTEIRNHSRQGTNLSSGERSLLAMFKEAAERNKEKTTDVLISLDQFYLSMARWVDTAVTKVISQAATNERILRPTDSDDFNIRVLRVLFMIKYVDKSIKPNIENITSLMIRSINEDRLGTREQVVNALEVLTKENLIRKNIDSYIFQTNEEQEITREITNQSVTQTDVIAELSTMIFDDKFPGTQFSFNKDTAGFNSSKFKNRYIFNYNQFVDDRPHRNSSYEMTVTFISPMSYLRGAAGELLTKSAGGRNIYVELPSDNVFMEDLTTAIKMNKYLSTTYSGVAKNFTAIRDEKSAELSELRDDLNRQLEESLKDATIYFDGMEQSVTGDFKTKIATILQKMAERVYHRLNLIDSPKVDSDIASLVNATGLDLVEDTSNQLALEDVKNFIHLQSQSNMTITMKLLKDSYVRKQPYGFVEEDIEWIIAKLFKGGDIALFFNNVSLSTTSDSKNLLDTIQNKRHLEKVKIELRVKATEKQRKLVAEISKELFESRNVVADEDDVTMANFKDKLTKILDDLTSFADRGGYHYPGSIKITENENILKEIVTTRNSLDFFKVLKKFKDELLYFGEDFRQIKGFHRSRQKQIWEKAIDNMSLIDEGVLDINSQKIDEIIEEMRVIRKQVDPYSKIPKLSELNQSFVEAYTEELEKESQIVVGRVRQEEQRTLENLASRELSENFETQVKDAFNDLEQASQTHRSVDKIRLVAVQAEESYSRFIKIFDAEENRLALANRQVSSIAEGDLDTIETEKPKREPVQRLKKTVPLRNLGLYNRQVKNELEIDKLTQEINQLLKQQLVENTDLTIEF
ncbi:BREX system P-loop protein BrxC [Vagococcus salmoninarum]|uniref:BREX system P-loop protein BrxC n=1 Tax=Vagococcus salmoninarum TaxID=2739 RepID=UPI003F9A2C8A